MDYQRIPYVDRPISTIVFGTATRLLDAVMPAAPSEKDALREKAFALLDEVSAMGINCFDCATMYGEEVLGDWITARRNREKTVILTKCAHPDEHRNRVTEADVRDDLARSLEKLKTDYIDIYLLHRDDPTVPVETIVDWMNRLHDEGMIGAFGGSNWSHHRLAAANDYAARNGLIPFTVSSPYFGLAEQFDHPWMGECVALTGAQNADARQWYQTGDLAIFAYSALARGFFSGKLRSDEPDKAHLLLEPPAIKGYCHPDNFERLRRAEQLAGDKGVTVAQIALAWLFCQPLQPFVVTATSTVDHVRQTVAALDITLTAAEAAWLNLYEK